MPIDYGRLRSLTARELIAALIRDGFTLDRQSGSHQCMIEDQARWTEEDLVRLGLL